MRRFDRQSVLIGALWVAATVSFAVALVDTWRDVVSLFRG